MGRLSGLLSLLLLLSTLLQLLPSVLSTAESIEYLLLPSVDEVVTQLDLTPDPTSGGWKKEIFRSNLAVDAPYGANRSALASSYFVIQDKLAWRRSEYSETWSYYWGSDTVTIYELEHEGGDDDVGSDDNTNPIRTTILGSHVLSGEVVQYSIGTGTWYAAKLNKPANDDDMASSSYALIGINSGPGTEASDWTKGNEMDLIDKFPNADVDLLINLSIATTASDGNATRPTTQPHAHACTFPPIQSLVELYDLQQHPEGGFFVETFRSQLVVNFTALGGAPRNALTSIYYAMFAGNNSDFHRLRADETWNYYFGETIYLYELTTYDRDGGSNLKTVVLGTNLSAGEVPEYSVRHGTWFAAEQNPNTQDKPGAYSLFGTNVGPGFEYEDWELGNATKLIRQFPGATNKILELTPMPMNEVEGTGAPSSAAAAATNVHRTGCGMLFLLLLVHAAVVICSILSF